MTSFRFIHAADIHLDSPLRGLIGCEGAAVELVRSATRTALDNLIGLAISERVDFLVIAGDLYDGDWRDFNTGLFFAGQMGRLNEKGIPAFVLHGNHDAASQITRRLELPSSVRVFSHRSPETFEICSLNVALHGQSYRQRAVTENLIPDYPPPTEDAFNIGVLHTGVGGMGGHANYAPCSLDDLANKGYDYWALGHVHRAQALDRNRRWVALRPDVTRTQPVETLHEQPLIVFPGNLQGRHVRETGPKGACLVTVEDGEVADLTHISCEVARWTVLRLDLNNTSDLDGVCALLRDKLAAAVAGEAEGRLLVCRIELAGRTEVHSRLIAAEDEILARARAVALGLGDEVAWIEQLVIATESAGGDGHPQPVGETRGAVDELQRMLKSAPADEDLSGKVRDDISKLVSGMPNEALKGFGHRDGRRGEIEDDFLRAAVDGDHAALIELAASQLPSRLNG